MKKTKATPVQPNDKSESIKATKATEKEQLRKLGLIPKGEYRSVLLKELERVRIPKTPKDRD